MHIDIGKADPQAVVEDPAARRNRVVVCGDVLIGCSEEEAWVGQILPRVRSKTGWANDDVWRDATSSASVPAASGPGGLQDPRPVHSLSACRAYIHTYAVSPDC